MRVLDINLRPPFDQLETIKFALQFAHVVKLNDEELGRLTKSSPRTSAELKIAAQKFSAAHAIDRVCVTAGARGAGLWWQGKWHWEPGRKVAVRDTVGAGDAFLGALLVALLRDQSTPAVALKRASRIGEFVATRDGATPPYRVDAHGGPVDK
jgi:fructokinase